MLLATNLSIKLVLVLEFVKSHRDLGAIINSGLKIRVHVRDLVRKVAGLTSNLLSIKDLSLWYHCLSVLLIYFRLLLLYMKCWICM